MLPLDPLPLWSIGLAMIGILSLIIELGYQAGKRLAKEEGLSKHPIEASVSAAMLGLLAFMLAFTFGTTVSRSGKSRDLAVADANLSHSLYLLTDLLPPEKGAEFRSLVREYLEIRSQAIADQDPAELIIAIGRSREIQQTLWKQLMAEEDPPKALITTLIKFIENDTSRQSSALYQRLPSIIWNTLGGLACLATALLGLNSGLHGRRSRLVATIFILAYSIVLLLIVDLDRPFRSLFKRGDPAAQRVLELMPEER